MALETLNVGDRVRINISQEEIFKRMGPMTWPYVVGEVAKVILIHGGYFYLDKEPNQRRRFDDRFSKCTIKNIPNLKK